METTATLDSLADELDERLLRGSISEPDAGAFLHQLSNVAVQTGLDGSAELPADLVTSLREALEKLCNQAQ